MKTRHLITIFGWSFLVGPRVAWTLIAIQRKARLYVVAVGKIAFVVVPPQPGRST